MTNRLSSYISAFLLCAIFIIAPWFHGVDLVWEQLALCGVIFALLGCLCFVRQAPAGPSKVISTGFMIWLIYSVAYLVPWPVAFTAFITPMMSHWYALANTEPHYLTVNWQASLIELIKFAGIAALFLSLWLFSHTVRKLRLVTWLILAGVASTVIYSLVNFYSAGAFNVVDAIQPWDLPWKLGIRGTFSYKNQYAMYLSLGFVVAVGLLVDAVRHRRSKVEMGVLISFLLLCLVALFNTSSRGALVSLALGVLLTGILYTVYNPSWIKGLLNTKVLVIAGVVTVVLGFGITQTSVYARFAEQKLADNGRSMLHNTAKAVFKDHPITGTGPGTYPSIQHVYKPMELGISKMSKRAHNDYLETLASTGIVGFTLLAIPLLALCLSAFRNVSTQADGLLWGCRAGVIAFLVQSAFDTNTGIYYLPVMFISLLTIASVISKRFAATVPDARTAGLRAVSIPL